MRKTYFACSYLISVAMLLRACSISISEASQPTPTPPQVSPIPMVLATDTPQSNGIGNPLLPMTTIPVTWSNLNLTGKLVFISAVQGSDGNPLLSIQALDLVTGAITTIFQGQPISWVYYVTVSP